LARLVLDPPVHVTAAAEARNRALLAVDRQLGAAWEELDLVREAQNPYTSDSDETVTVCRRCDGVDTHEPDCPLVRLTASALVTTYELARRQAGGAL
jgi:hypothetical protein